MIEYTLVPSNTMELRTADDDRHYVEGIAVPWGKRTDKAAVPEMFDRGAFADLVRAQAKVKLTDYNHSRDRIPVGGSTLIEDRDEGLWMRFRLHHTPEGTSAHDNIADGVYGGLSIGFIAKSDRRIDGVRHVTSAHLDHVSLVTEPAYADAVILDLRAAIESDRDEWREILANRPAPLDTARYVSQNLLIAQIRRGSN